MQAILAKWGLKIVAVVAILFGVYMFGHSNGYDSGYKTGHDEQQKVIDGMVNAEKQRVDSNNAKLNKAEQQAPVAVQQVQAQVKAQVQYRDRVITQYYEKNPDLNKLCSWNQDQVDLINQVIAPANAASTAQGN